MYWTTEYFDVVGPVKENMPQDALTDLIWCMCFSDNWDGGRKDGWESLCIDKNAGNKPGTIEHQNKIAQSEFAYNAR